jgi:hypothetical protein
MSTSDELSTVGERFAEGDSDQMQAYAAELVGSASPLRLPSERGFAATASYRIQIGRPGATVQAQPAVKLLPTNPTNPLPDTWEYKRTRSKWSRVMPSPQGRVGIPRGSSTSSRC